MAATSPTAAQAGLPDEKAVPVATSETTTVPNMTDSRSQPSASPATRTATRAAILKNRPGGASSCPAIRDHLDDVGVTGVVGVGPLVRPACPANLSQRGPRHRESVAEVAARTDEPLAHEVLPGSSGAAGSGSAQSASIAPTKQSLMTSRKHQKTASTFFTSHASRSTSRIPLTAWVSPKIGMEVRV